MSWAYQPLLPGAAQLLASQNWTLAVDAASFDVDGQNVGLEWANKYDPAQFDIDGQVIALTIGTPITVDSAAFDIDGSEITLTWVNNWTLPVTEADFQVDGQTIPFNLSEVLTKADIQPAGQDVALVWTQNWTLAVDSASFQIDGQSVTFGLSVAVTPATFQIDGQELSLIAPASWLLEVDSIALSVLGSEIELSYTQIQTQEATGGWLYAARRERLQREWEEELERRELEAEADRLEAHLIETGSLPKSLPPELKRVRDEVELYKYDSDLPKRAKRAIEYAARAQTELAYRLAQRELRRMQEEEEFAVLMTLALD